ncbi:hypothetical protein [Curtobacterium sp. MCSS17_016]|uniref:hypothetical protein n=1 Tax=Curtobacterium sp. MCSS17_016 TaxID=2175644 RepID=UPI000DAA7D95|nr:hypothetical protein [Curtobacterium sp. MCSS17_016]WIE81504.1 hypothetical protein DEJ19_019905 [Curtobacterium sp. MCSS17_016]
MTTTRTYTRERDVAGLPPSTKFASRQHGEPAVALTPTPPDVPPMIPDMPAWSAPTGQEQHPASPWAPGFEPDTPTLRDGPDDPIGFDFDYAMDQFQPATIVPDALGIRDAAVDSITIRDLGSYYDGYQFAMTATKQVNLLTALNPGATDAIQSWLHENREIVPDFFATTYRADAETEAGFDSLDVTVRASVPVTTDRTITPMQAYAFTAHNTMVRQMQSDVDSGRIRELFREHTQNTVIRTNRAVGYELDADAPAEEQHDYQTRSKTEAVQQAVERDGRRRVSDKTAFWLCQTVPRQQYPELYRFALNRVGDKRTIAAELEHAINTSAAAGFKPGQRESLHALWNYFAHGADND